MSLSMEVEDLQGLVVGPIATVAEALLIIDTREVAAAILDANLADRGITPVALLLARRGIPFIVHSATGIPEELALALPALPFMCKAQQPCVVLASLCR